jgi:UMP-CMP kinase
MTSSTSDDYRHSSRTPMVLSFCPFSLGVFLGTALLVTLRQRQLRLKQLDRGDSIDVDVNLDSLDDLPVCQVVFVLGGPGSGKGTQCELLTTRSNDWAHLSAGDLLRAERSSGGPIGDLINKRIAAGQLVPAEITCKLLENGMKTLCRDKQITKFLIDGFPRNQANIDAWVQTMTKHSVEFVLYFECPEEVLVGRLLERGQTSGRSDDTMEVIRKRFQTDKESTSPIVQMFEKEGKVRKIASDKPVEDVYRDVAALFENL